MSKPLAQPNVASKSRDQEREGRERENKPNKC